MLSNTTRCSTKTATLALLALLCAGCSQTPHTPLLDNSLAYGDVRVLNRLTPSVDKNLMLRLYKVPSHDHSCGIETEQPCNYVYTLSVSTFDEHPEVNTYSLGTGYISDIAWLNEGAVDTVKLQYTMKFYSDSATPPTEQRVEQHVISVTPKTLIQMESANPSKL
ncbi:hypothetical protein Q4583_10315 [Neptunomonas phycophila]|uniref:hypothetical protein n=1 Tax=Neptunomonas phycophila TaxID=1572645 RepID=UPI0026E3D7C3|nr:hypothetical protein [Neptunomonas phycophila]MDO6784509.1 hypothetical protein [Neptunomonas phycophila]